MLNLYGIIEKFEKHLVTNSLNNIDDLKFFQYPKKSEDKRTQDLTTFSFFFLFNSNQVLE